MEDSLNNVELNRLYRCYNSLSKEKKKKNRKFGGYICFIINDKDVDLACIVISIVIELINCIYYE